MKKIRIPVFAVLVLAILSQAARAGDYADFKFIGFSANGKFLAFEESGEWDGSGGDYATTYYVNTVKNSYAARPSVFEWSMESPAKREPLLLARYKRSVALNLKRFGIVRGNNGQMVVAHLLNDLSYVTPVDREHHTFRNHVSAEIVMPDYEGGFIRRDGGGIEKIIFNPMIDPYNQNTEEFYELTLDPTLAAGKDCSEAYKINLTLKSSTNYKVPELRVLQNDSDDLPKARNCPFGYKIERVYVYEDKVAVFLNVFSQGFEGPDMRYMVVTGKMQ